MSHWVYATGFPLGNKVAINLAAIQVIQVTKMPMPGGLIGQVVDVSELYLGGLTIIPLGLRPDGSPGYQISFATTCVRETVAELFALPRIKMGGDAEVRRLALVPGPFAPGPGPSDGQGGVGGPPAGEPA